MTNKNKKAKEQDLNPRNDPDVQKGIDSHVLNQATRTKNVEPKDPKYFVKKSHQRT